MGDDERAVGQLRERRHEHAGHGGPQAMQRLLREAVWDADAVRDHVRELVVDTLGRPDGVLIPDETGFLKKGM
jgi:SRSO17 transposase